MFLSITYCNGFSRKSENCNFASDRYNTLYSFGQDVSDIMRNLKHDMKIILNLFKINSLKKNLKKFKIMILGMEKQNKITLKINPIVIREINFVVLFGITSTTSANFTKKKKNFENFKSKILNYLFCLELEYNHQQKKLYAIHLEYYAMLF